jgi:hypothetical protein
MAGNASTSAPRDDVNDVRFWRRAFASRAFVTGLVLSLMVLAAGAISFIWTPHPTDGIAIADRLQAPSATKPAP